MWSNSGQMFLKLSVQISQNQEKLANSLKPSASIELIFALIVQVANWNSGVAPILIIKVT